MIIISLKFFDKNIISLYKFGKTYAWNICGMNFNNLKFLVKRRLKNERIR